MKNSSLSYIIMIILLGVSLYAYTQDSFTNGLTEEGIIFIDDEIVNRYISLPLYVNISSARMSFNGFNVTNGNYLNLQNLSQVNNTYTFTETVLKGAYIQDAILTINMTPSVDMYSTSVGQMANNVSNIIGNWSAVPLINLTFKGDNTNNCGGVVATDHCYADLNFTRYNNLTSNSKIETSYKLKGVGYTANFSFMPSCLEYSNNNITLKLELFETAIADDSDYIKIYCKDNSGYTLLFNVTGGDTSWIPGISYVQIHNVINNDTIVIDNQVFNSNISEVNYTKEINITNELNNVLDTCSCTGCSIVGENCSFPITFNEIMTDINKNVSYVLNITYGVNMSISVGNLDTFNYTNTSPSNFSFVNQLNNVLNSSCTCTGCTATSSTCTIPLTFHSDTAGILEVTDLEINYTYTFELTNCTQGVPSLNFTIRDETTSAIIPSNITTDFLYTFDDIDKNYSPAYTTRSNFSVCIYPNYAEFGGNYTIAFEAVNYPQRRYTNTNAIFDNQTQAVTLYLLGSGDGMYVRFRTTDTYGNTLTNVQVSMQKEIGGVLTTVEQQSTDDSGMATFWADPDSDYVFTFTKTGYDTAYYSLRPTTSEIITIEMGEETTTTTNYADGILYSYSPESPLNRMTTYRFQYNLTSVVWDLANCTMLLTNGTDYPGTSVVAFNTSACDGYIDADTGTSTLMYFYLTYTINDDGEHLKIISTTYNVVNFVDTNFTLMDALGEFQYIGSGWDDFGQMLLALFAIILIAGAAVGTFQFTDEPEPVLIIILILTWAFSVVGWFQIESLSLPDIPTLKQFHLAYIVTLACLGWLVARFLSR